MIYKLRKKFIGISVISVIAVLSVVFCVAAFSSVRQLNRSIDGIAETLSQNDGGFPEGFDFPKREKPPENDSFKPQNRLTMPNSGFMTPESRFTTRYFVVKYDSDGNIIENNTEQITSVTDEEAAVYAEKAMSSKKDRGWISDFRFNKYETDEGEAVLFIDGTSNKNMTIMFVSSLAAVFFVTALVIIILLILISKKAIKPIAESYDKQKMFITDASHELKTPLTVIMTDLDIIESENGGSEWIDDIRAEGKNMTELIGHLVSLSRMDESNADLMVISDFSLSELCKESVDKFDIVAKESGLKLESHIDRNINYKGDDRLIRQLISIFMDNAIKYCDDNGEIIFKLKNEKHPVIEVINTYSDINNLELDRLKERFYRADKARTSGTGYGIGLSLADSIVSLHKGKIKISKYSDNQISFKVVL